MEPGKGHIRHFATHPGHLGHGYAKQIMDACLHQARSAGMTQMECFSTLTAEGFYTAMGFQTEHRIDVDIQGVAFPSLVMRLAI